MTIMPSITFVFLCSIYPLDLFEELKTLDVYLADFYK